MYFASFAIEDHNWLGAAIVAVARWRIDFEAMEVVKTWDGKRNMPSQCLDDVINCCFVRSGSLLFARDDFAK